MPTMGLIDLKTTNVVGKMIKGNFLWDLRLLMVILYYHFHLAQDYVYVTHLHNVPVHLKRDNQINQQRRYLLLIQPVIAPPLVWQLMSYHLSQKSDHDGHNVEDSVSFSKYWLIEFHCLFQALDIPILDANSSLGQVTDDDQFYRFV